MKRQPVALCVWLMLVAVASGNASEGTTPPPRLGSGTFKAAEQATYRNANVDAGITALRVMTFSGKEIAVKGASCLNGTCHVSLDGHMFLTEAGNVTAIVVARNGMSGVHQNGSYEIDRNILAIVSETLAFEVYRLDLPLRMNVGSVLAVAWRNMVPLQTAGVVVVDAVGCRGDGQRGMPAMARAWVVCAVDQPCDPRKLQTCVIIDDDSGKVVRTVRTGGGCKTE